MLKREKLSASTSASLDRYECVNERGLVTVNGCVECGRFVVVIGFIDMFLTV